jgi:hypothetical protein
VGSDRQLVEEMRETAPIGETAPIRTGGQGTHKPVSATAPLSRFLDAATRLVPSLESLPDPNTTLAGSFEKIVLPAALVSAFAGIVLFAAGTSFALAAICLVAAIVLLFFGGLVPLRRFLASDQSSPSIIVADVEQATQRAAWMISCILLLMASNPIFASKYIDRGSALPIETLSLIIGAPAVLMMIFAIVGTPLERRIQSAAFGAANVFVLSFAIFLLVLFIFANVNLSTARLNAVARLNQYVFIFSPIAAAVLGIYVFLCRMTAKQRLRILRSISTGL